MSTIISYTGIINNRVSLVVSITDLCSFFTRWHFRYELMLLCWNYESEKRIHFDEIRSYLDELLSNPGREQPAIWYTYDVSTTTAARNTLDSVLSHIEPPASTSFESSDAGECRSSTSGCFSSMTGSISPMHQHGNSSVVSYQLRLIDDTMSNDFVDEDNHSDIIKQSLQWTKQDFFRFFFLFVSFFIQQTNQIAFGSKSLGFCLLVNMFILVVNVHFGLFQL